jgi:hypothetical protein
LGIIDRDYWSEAQSRANGRSARPPESSLSSWTIGFVVTLLVAAAAFAPTRWFPNWLGMHLERGRQGTLLATPRAPVTFAQAPMPLVVPVVQQTVQCVVNGTPVVIAGVTCPKAASSAANPTITRPAAQTPTESPFRKPGTIYRCKSYSGGLFWSDTHCSKHNALIDRIASVPVGMAFQQQVDIASGEANRVEQSIERERRESARSTLCSSLSNEREQIWKRSGAGAGHVPLDELGRDQTRWRHIESLLRANSCNR